MRFLRKIGVPLVSGLLLTGIALLTGCGQSRRTVSGSMIRTDGSSTVFPITRAVADAFRKENPDARVSLNISGTSGGFARFCAGDTDVQNASRPINAAEVTACNAAGIRYLEVPVAHDGLTIVVNHKNTWMDTITVKELDALWRPSAEGKVTRWDQVRAAWPKEPIHLFGPGHDSGTFDFFTEVIVGQARSSRKDFTSSEDDDVIVQGVAADEFALGYVGFTYFEQHKDTLRAVPVDDGNNDIGPGAIEPSVSNVRRGIYRPLSRPLFIYVNAKSLDRPEVDAFLKFYIRQDEELVARAGGIPLNAAVYRVVQERVTKRVVGSAFQDPAAFNMSLEMVLTQSAQGGGAASGGTPR